MKTKFNKKPGNERYDLYESIMTKVSKYVKQRINESDYDDDIDLAYGGGYDSSDYFLDLANGYDDADDLDETEYAPALNEIDDDNSVLDAIVDAIEDTEEKEILFIDIDDSGETEFVADGSLDIVDELPRVEIEDENGKFKAVTVVGIRKTNFSNVYGDFEYPQIMYVTDDNDEIEYGMLNDVKESHLQKILNLI